MGIEAKIVAHSKSSITGKEIVTYQVTHHRFILAEMNKHRMLSNSYQSSRAVPVEKMLESVKNNCAYPVSFGKNKAGMQADEELDERELEQASFLWQMSSIHAANRAGQLAKLGTHKQLANRITEPFQWTTGIITGTEWENFFYLRRDSAAQPEFRALADKMWEAYEQSEPEILQSGEWHTPFIEHLRCDGQLYYALPRPPICDGRISLEDALKYSAASCAQISFRKLDQSVETLERVAAKLLPEDGIPHSVPFEHQATPMENAFPKIYFNGKGDVEEKSWIQEGVTHFDRKGNAWSGNFQGWIQNRKVMEQQ